LPIPKGLAKIGTDSGEPIFKLLYSFASKKNHKNLLL